MSEVERVPAFCAQCRSRCGCIAEVRDGRLHAVEPLPGHPSGERLCPKGLASAELVEHPDRLRRPMRRTAPKGAADPGFEPIGWDEALDTIADRLKQVARENGPEATAFAITTGSGTHISDGLPWIERLVRAYGSPNTLYGTEICNWHKDFATRFTFGHDIGVPDFAQTDLMVLWGNNPSATWLARAVEMEHAQRRGAGLVVVDPRPTPFARRADVWLQLRPGTDQALALGLARALLERGAEDRDYLRRWSNGPMLVRRDSGRFLRASDLGADGRDDILFGIAEDGSLLRYDGAECRWLDDRLPVLRRAAARPGAGDLPECTTAFERYEAVLAEWTPERVAAVTGVPEADQAAAVERLAEAGRVAYYAWNGIAQSTTATQTDRALTLLYALTGSYGRAGGNVPGAAAPFADLSGWDLVQPGQAALALGLEERPVGPPARGWVTAEAIWNAVLDGDPYPVRNLICFGTNPLVSQPGEERTAEALKAVEFHVHADFFLNSAARYADIVLPVSTSWEREALRAGFDASLEGQRRVQYRPPVVAPVGESRSDTDIVMALAERLGMADRFFDLDVDAGHAAMLAPAGLTLEAVKAVPEGLDVPGTVALDAFAEEDADGRPVGFPTPTGRIEFWSETLLDNGAAPVPALDADVLPAVSDDFPLMLGCGKSLVYCHGQHRNLPSLRALQPDPPLEMAAEDAAARGLKNGDWARIVTATGEAFARVRITRRLVPGAVFGQHGWWEGGTREAPYGTQPSLAANLNRVVDHRRDPVSGSLSLRAMPCEVVPLDNRGTDAPPREAEGRPRGDIE